MKKKTTTKLLAICLACLLTVCGLQAPLPRFGPGLSDAAAAAIDLGVLTPTNIVPSDGIVFPPSAALSENTSTAQEKNILSVVSLFIGGIQEITFQMKVFPYLTISDTDFKFYDYKSNDELLLTITDEIDTKGYITIEYTPYESKGEGYVFLYCGYNTTDDVAEAKRAIMPDVLSGMLSNEIEINGIDDYAIQSVELLMGDINNDNTINDLDKELIIMAVEGTITLTEHQRLAADVNRDGSVNLVDWLQIEKYIAGKINSFWGTSGIVPLPTTDSIIDGNYYKLFNRDGTYRLIGYKNSDGISLGYSNGISTTHNFQINSGGGGLCTIQNVFSGKYISANSDGSLSYVSGITSDFSQFWYLSANNGAYYLVNYKYTDKLLTDELELTRNMYGAEWELEPLILTLKYHYNYGYRYRAESMRNLVLDKDLNGDGTINADDTAIRVLSSYQNQIGTILEELFHLQVETQSPSIFYSREDSCYTTEGNISGITASDVVDSHATNGNPTCSTCYNVDCFSGINTHHRNSNKGIEYYDQETENGTYQINLLTSGYKPCGVWDSNNDGVIEHSTVGGLARWWTFTAAVYHGTDWAGVDDLAALHEISHCLGAVNSPADSVHYKNSVGQGVCVMSYERADETLTAYWQQGNYRSLFCDDCYENMDEFIKLY